MKKRHLLALALIPALLAACGGSDDSFDDRADIADPKVRLVHAVPGAPNVTLFRDDQTQGAQVTNMAYKGASNYFDTGDGTHRGTCAPPARLRCHRRHARRSRPTAATSTRSSPCPTPAR